MTDQTTADLIAEGRRRDREVLGEPGILSQFAAALEAAEQRAKKAERERDRLDEAFDRDLPWRYAEVETQRNQLAAVVEKARLYCENQGDKFRYHAQRVTDLLSAPTEIGENDEH